LQASPVKPALRLIRGRSPRLLPSRPPPRPRTVAPPRARVGQLVFVLAMAAVGLVALATSVGQILARVM
jgi:hypothetical protein